MALTLEEYEKLNPRTAVEHGGVEMLFWTPTVFTRWRVETIFEKEPCTLEWIAGFEPGDTLFDCGANVGMYTVWAAATRGVEVYAFEPEAQNYALLNRNVLLNGLSERVHAYCLGLSDEAGFSTLHMSDLRPGGSNHALGEALDYRLEPFQALFRQATIADTMDALVSAGRVPVPTHVKVDVDGLEPRVIAGARETLARPAVRSLLIEVNQNVEAHRRMVEQVLALGFRYDPAQVARAERKDGAFKGLAEYVFKR